VEIFKIVLENILPILFAVLMPIMVVLGRWFVRYLERKLSFDMSTEMENQLLGYVYQGVSYAEEKAMAAVKINPNDMTSGQAKLDRALDYVREQIQRQGWDDIAGEKLSRMIEAALNQMRPEKPPA